MDTGGEVRDALDIKTTVLTDPAQRERVPEHAERLARRHNEHLIGADFIRLIRSLKERDATAAVVKSALLPLRRRALHDGFFLQGYSPAFEEEKLRDPHYVIAEAWGRHPLAHDTRNAEPAPWADCQCCLPDASLHAFPVPELPDPSRGDVISEPNIVADLQRCPWKYGEVKDITTQRGMGNLRFAGWSRRRAFHEIQKEKNPQRGDFPVQHMCAAVAAIYGYRVPDGSVVTLRDLGEPASLKNERSVLIHLEGSYPAIHSFVLVGREVPVDVDGEPYVVVLNWHVFVHDFQRMRSGGQ